MDHSQSGINHDHVLLDAVRKQIEYYFSKENLQNDVFLTSQMDAQLSVPISIVMKFAKLKALTLDEELVRHALVDSTVVSIIDNKIRANIRPSNRSTIILREIPSDADEKEVREIFHYEGCKNILSIRSDIGDTW
jgi:la-related protein 4